MVSWTLVMASALVGRSDGEDIDIIGVFTVEL
jgi:hypothetical protein